MDVDQMTSSVLQAMAGAVENAAVVVYCLSSAYKESEACRTEGEYAYNLRKAMVPVKPESGYRPDGWLGALTGNKLYFEFSNPSHYQSKAEDLLKEVLRHGVTKADSSAPLSPDKPEVDEAKAVRMQLAQAEQAVKDLQKQIHQNRSPAPNSGAADVRSLNIRIDELERRIETLELELQRSKGCCTVQ
jgi:hypothetical protein